jgi:oleandomycin transport system ATP-binding protein
MTGTTMEAHGRHSAGQQAGTVVAGGTSAGQAVEVRGLVKTFKTTRALDGVDLTVRTGTVHALLGPNGAGKTTIVRVLATLLRPDGGQASVGGYDVVRDAAAVRRTIGLTGQYAAVDEDLTGTQNLVLIGRLLDLSGAQARARAAELLRWFDLTDAANRMAKTYSGGMRRRLDLAASLVGRPSVIFLDEPTTGLDPAKREDMWGVVRSLVAEGSTVLLTTQYLEEADQLADEITVIDHGRVIAHDTPDGLKRVLGGRRLAVRPVDPTDVPAVREILAWASGAEPEIPERGTVRVAVADGNDVLERALAELGRRNVSVLEVSLHLPDLDEVFLSLTDARHMGGPEPTDLNGQPESTSQRDKETV